MSKSYIKKYKDGVLVDTIYLDEEKDDKPKTTNRRQKTKSKAKKTSIEIKRD